MKILLDILHKIGYHHSVDNDLKEDRSVNSDFVLNEKWINHMTTLPETGMGYQIVDIKLASGHEIKGVTVLNASQVVLVMEEDKEMVKSSDISEIKLSY